MPFPVVAAVTGFFSPKVWKFLGVIALIALVLFLFWRALDNYGDARYDDGIAAERAAWEEADRKLQIEVAKAQTESTAGAVKREERHAAAVAKEREKIDEAVAEGRSPFDVLFGTQRL